MLGWAVRDRFVPTKAVTVLPVIVSRPEVQQAGTPLFQAAGWIEPRPTPVLAAALAEGIIVADEPTGSLDAATSEQIQVLLRRLNQELGMTLLMVTHDTQVASIGTRRLRLDRGKLERFHVPPRRGTRGTQCCSTSRSIGGKTIFHRGHLGEGRGGVQFSRPGRRESRLYEPGIPSIHARS